MPYIAVGDISIYYEIHGSGPRLLYIPGTGGDLRKPGNVFGSPLAERFEILAYDQRGLGRTSRPDVPYSMAGYADDAAGLLAAVGWSRCSVLGVSFGGMVAQELALRHPESVERMVLACTSSGGRGGSSYPVQRFREIDDPEERVRTQMAQADTRRDLAWQQDHAELVAPQVDAAKQPQVGADEPNREIGAIRQLEARADHDTYDRLPAVRLPVLVGGGRFDGIARPENLSALHQRISGSRLELFDGGHGFLDQDPAAYRAITAFLTETR